MNRTIWMAFGCMMLAAGCASKVATESETTPGRVAEGDATESLVVVKKYVPPVPGPTPARLAHESARQAASTIDGFAIVQEPEGFDTESYDAIDENPFLDPRHDPRSTFSIDVDTASYANVRRFLRGGSLPPAGAVRIEELVNYFSYDYPAPRGNDPFSVDVEIGPAPWNERHRLARIGIQGVTMEAGERPDANLVFLLDVSGSMQAPNKLPLLQHAMRLLLDGLGDDDRVAIVVYAGAAGTVLPPTAASDRASILEAIESLEAGGSTAGGAGIRLAYATAREQFEPGAANRVILCTDGDFNVGVTNRSDLVELIEDQASEGIFLTVLGFGMGNYKDATLEQLADRGNGNYAYIDTRHEARKVLVEEVGGTLVTIAKDVKIQVEFNPAEVASYRLIGYENRLLHTRDFNDDTRDAGEIGAGHAVTALYEIVPAGETAGVPPVDPLKYQETVERDGAGTGGELLTLKVRYKTPQASTSRLLEMPIVDDGTAKTSDDFRFAAAVAGFGMLLRGSEHLGDRFDLGRVEELARESLGEDSGGYRTEFVDLVGAARRLVAG